MLKTFEIAAWINEQNVEKKDENLLLERKAKEDSADITNAVSFCSML